jgi:hypothetical protein
VRTPSFFTLRAMAVGLGILLTRGSAPASGLPDLSGTWKLNAAQSDDPQQKLRENGSSSSGSGTPSDSGDEAPPQGSGGSGGGYGGHHGGGRGGWGHRRGGGNGGGDGSGWLEARERLVIHHVDPELTITDASGRERTLYTDGRKTEEERSLGGTTAVHALWKDGHVEVTSQPERGPKMVQTFTVSADRSQLTVTTKFEGRRAVSIRSVYDAVRGAPAQAAPPADDDSNDPPEDTR